MSAFALLGVVLDALFAGLLPLAAWALGTPAWACIIAGCFAAFLQGRNSLRNGDWS